MNFRTTILLLVVLIAAAVVYFVTSGRDSGTDKVDTTERPDGEAGKKLIDVSTGDVNRVAITSASGDRLVFERVGTSEWRLAEPVKGPADAFKVDELLRQVTDLRSRGQVDAKDKGVDKPRYVVELTDKNNKVTKLNVGSRSPVGDMLYVRLEGDDEADVVSSSVVAQLAKEAGEYRKTRVVNVPTDKVTTISIAQPDKTLRLEKNPANDKWQIVEPAKMPADAGQVSSLISSVNSLDAVRFVEETAAGAGLYGLSKPSLTVTLGTAPPETQPTTGPSATTRPAGEQTTVKFGRPDVEKTNVYAMASESGPVVTVAATSLDAFRKTPLDLRDREVLDVNPDAVSRISITKEAAPATQPSATQPATQPAAQPGAKTVVTLERRSEVTPVGPPAPVAPAAPTAAPAPQSRVTTPDGEGAVTLAAFQEPAAAPAGQGAQPTSATRRSGSRGRDEARRDCSRRARNPPQRRRPPLLRRLPRLWRRPRRSRRRRRRNGCSRRTRRAMRTTRRCRRC